MPLEMVLLSERPPTPQLLEQAGAMLLPGGRVRDYGPGRVRQFIGPDGAAALSVLGSRVIEGDLAEAKQTLSDLLAEAEQPPPEERLRAWTELVIPAGADPEAALAVAASVMTLAGGQLWKRW